MPMAPSWSLCRPASFLWEMAAARILRVSVGVETLEPEMSNTINKPIHLVLGGTHLLPAKDDQINSIALSLRDNWGVRYLAPVHCTGEPAFAGPRS